MCSRNIFGHRLGEASLSFSGPKLVDWGFGLVWFGFLIFKNKAMSERFRALERDRLLVKRVFNEVFKNFM